MTFEKLTGKIAKLIDKYETSTGNTICIHCELQETNDSPLLAWDGERFSGVGQENKGFERCDDPGCKRRTGGF